MPWRGIAAGKIGPGSGPPRTRARITPAGPVPATLAADVITPPGGTRLLVVTAGEPGEGRLAVADLALAEELGRHLGAAIRVDRMFRHRSAVAEALQSSLLPASLPDVPGLELSAAYVPGR